MTGLKKALAVVLAFQLAWGSVPVQAWEEALGADESAVEEAVVDFAADAQAEPEAELGAEGAVVSESDEAVVVPEAVTEYETTVESEAIVDEAEGAAVEAEAVADDAVDESVADDASDEAVDFNDPGNDEANLLLEADLQALQAQTEGAQEEVPVGGAKPEREPALSIHEGEGEDLEALASLPSSYDSRTKNVITSVRNQNPFGICWSFAALAAAEASLLTQGIGGSTSSLDLSERHLAYFAFHNQKDPLGGTEGDQTLPKGSAYGQGMASDPYLISGGNLAMTELALASWMGAAREDAVGSYGDLANSYYQMTLGDLTESQFFDKTNLDASLARTKNVYRLANSKRISFEDRADVKKAIMEHGAVATALLFDGQGSDGYNFECSTMYNATAENTSHIVSIVGWDDNFDPKYFGKDNGIVRLGDGDAPTASGTLTLNKKYTVSKSSTSGYKWYSFKATKSGYHTFSVGGDTAPSFLVYATAEDGKISIISGGYDGSGSGVSQCTCGLAAGTTYYVGFWCDEDLSYTINVAFDKAFDASMRPKNKGAWLCKNSWGADSSRQSGYFWLSYEEPSLFLDGVKAYAFDMRAAGDLDNIYQYDGSESEFYNIVESGGSIANVFKAAASTGESLKEVGFSLADVNVNYSIQVYLNLTNSKVPTSGVPYFKTPVTGSTTYAGYYTVALPTAVPLHKGTDFAVVITLSHNDGSVVGYNVDASGEDDWHKCVSAVKAGQSFEQDRKGAAWDDLASTKRDELDEPTCVARIKAFTTNTSPAKRSVAYAGVTVSPTTRVYDGTAKTPTVAVRYGTTTLKEGTDYTISGLSGDFTSVGLRTFTITGKGSFTGTRKVTHRIAFKDVASSHWGYAVVHRANDLGLVTGYTGAKTGNFGPEDNITRGQAAVILWRMAGKPAAGAGAKSFSDVAKGAYYYDAVRWASSAGVVSGYATGEFGPDDNVTREQLAVMLANYAKRIGRLTVDGSAADYANMKDASKVAGYARPAVGWCFRNKILSGSQGNVDPKGKATRAQAAKMLVGLYDLVK